MSAWTPGGSPSEGGVPSLTTNTTRQFTGSGYSPPTGDTGGLYHPEPSGGIAPAANNDIRPGAISLNPLDPGQTIQDAKDPISKLFNGLRQALVGGNETHDGTSPKSDQSLLGNIPVIGNLGRGFANALGGGGEAVGAATALVGGTAERIPSGNSAILQAQFDEAKNEALKSEDGKKFYQKYQDAIDRENGLFGTGLLDDNAHIQSAFIRAWRQNQQYEHPSLAPGAFTAPGSLVDEISNLMDAFSTSATVAARGWAGMSTPGQEGMSRLDLIKAVGDGKTGFREDKGFLGTGLLAGDPTTGLNEAEQLVYNKVRSGDWTDAEALDFLASNGQAFGHSAIANIGGSVAVDPLNIATFGAGAAAKLGATGLTYLSRWEKATQVLNDLGKSYEAAAAAREAATGARAIKIADKALAAAKADVEAAQTSVDAFKAYHSGAGGFRAINFLARDAEGSQNVAKGLRLAGRVYRGLEGTSIGRAAKVMRTIIDPLHAVDLHLPGGSRVVDIYSDSVPRAVAGTAGVNHYKGMLDEALRLDPTRGMYDAITSDFGVASTNLAREGLVDMFRANQIAGNLGEKLMSTLPEDIYETAVQTTKHKDLEKWLRFNTVKSVLKDTWSEADHATLAKGLEQAYHTRTAEEWMKVLPGLSKEQKSLYKFAVYGHANRALLDLTGRMAPEVAAKLAVAPSRMVLLAKGTLTRVGGESLLTKLTAMKSTKAKLRIIADWQERYASLRYVSMDPSNLERSVDRFVQHLEESLDRLPMQLTKDELKALGDEGDNLRAAAGEYSLGFAPEDRFKWGLERDNGTGLYRPAGSAWADHVADGATPYRPAAALRMNIAGHPLVDVPVVRAGVRLVDHMDSAVRMMKSQVSGAMITEAARKQFIHRATTTGDLAAHGVTETVANSWFERIQEFTREHQGYSGPRGFSDGELYNAIRDRNLIPQPLLNGAVRLTPDDVMRMVLQAYDGDMRMIGLTQKLSSRVKRAMFEMTGGSNFAGQIAEHAWPTLKFRYNPLFQLQEKIEPWVLNAQRGVSFATGVKMSESDHALEALLKRMTDNSLVRQADLDIAEQSGAVLVGGLFKKSALRQGTALNRMQEVAQSITEVQGMKRLNMLRTFKQGLGKDVKAAWEAGRPGEWEQLKEFADLRAGRVLSDDDFALQMISENAFANDVFVNRVLDKAGKFTGLKADPANAIKTGAWHTPTTLGELKALDLDHVAKSMHFPDGKGGTINTLNELREYIGNKREGINDVVDGLTRLGADPDYIRRVQHALEFNWNGFWKTAETRFSLTAKESGALQDMMANAAQLRGMTPVEYMSQVFSPSLRDGTEGTLGHIEGTARLLREARAAGRKIKPREAKLSETRTVLAGKEGVSTREDLVRQLSSTFSAHLDPSAKRALLEEFARSDSYDGLVSAVNKGALRMDLQDVETLWDSQAENELANRILGYMDGKPPTHAASELDDTRGLASVRDAAARYMRERGVEPLTGRPHFKLDSEMEAHYDQTAQAFRDLPDVPFEKTGRIPNARSLDKSTLDLKPKPDGVDDRTYESYQAFVQDTRAQYDFMTRSKDKGGLGLKVVVSRTDPYTSDAAGRAAMAADIERGTLKVFGGQADHSLMTNEQNVMFRAVHDVFGHSAEGFEFGPRGELNAAAKHARMYSNEGRPAMLTETHGQTAYVNYSNDIYQPTATVKTTPLDPADPAADFEKRYPFKIPEHQQAQLGPDDPRMGAVELRPGREFNPLTGEQLPQPSFGYYYQQRVGDGIRALPKDQQAMLLQPMADLFDQFPNLSAFHIDAVDFGAPLNEVDGVLTGLGQTEHANAMGLTWGPDDEEPVIFFNTKYLQLHGTDWSANKVAVDATRHYDAFYKINPLTGKLEDTARASRFGAPYNAGYDAQYVIRHEAGHAFDIARRPRRNVVGGMWVQSSRSAADLPYHDMMVRFEQEAGRLDLSEYGMHSGEEFAAELFAYATDPNLIVKNIESEPLRNMVEEYQQFLKDSGEWKPILNADPMAGKTVAEVNRLQRGTVYAPQKAGILPQNILDEFTSRFVGTSKHVESNPDVARAANMFGQWTDKVVANGLLRGDHGVYAGILRDAKGLPTAEAVPFNYNEAAITNLAYSSMTRKWDDAFRLQYFSQERSLLERSINHPMFGLYPASYMWGKLMPEMVRFLASQPFGIKTGGVLRSLTDVQAAIAMRREYDPTFDAKIEALGHSQAMSFLGYLLPTLPWDIQANAPAWMQQIATQGEANASAAQGKAKGIDIGAIVTKPIEKLNPLEMQSQWGKRAIGEVFHTPTTQEAAKDAVDLHKAVQASELKPVMQRVMQELQEALR